VTEFTCPLCGEHRFAVLESQDDWLARAAASVDERKVIGAIVANDPDLAFGAIVRCKSCELATLQHRPSGAALGGFYERYYANQSYATKREKKIARARKRIRRLAKLTDGKRFLGKRFLDVGASLGFAVEAARLEGFDAHGVELDPDAVAKAKAAFPGCHFEAGSAGDVAARGETFDIVYCSEVIEHVPDFRGFADALLRLVAPGGVLFVTTPAEGHPRTPKPLVSWVQVKPPEHLVWFRRAHLRTLFDKPGYRYGRWVNVKPGHKLVIRLDRA
jgi:SAM-dependent methyltransferase